MELNLRRRTDLTENRCRRATLLLAYTKIYLRSYELLLKFFYDVGFDLAVRPALSHDRFRKEGTLDLTVLIHRRDKIEILLAKNLDSDLVAGSEKIRTRGISR